MPHRFTLPFFSLLLIFTSFAVQAQNFAETAAPAVRPATIPVEVAFIYAKLLNTQPDFNALAVNSPKVQNTPEFGRDALIAQERHSLEQVFKSVKRDNLITIRDVFQIDTIAPSLKTVQFKEIDADTPFNFDVGNVTYGVFIRNAANSVSPLQAPFYKSTDWVTLQKASLNRQALPVEITLRPLGADAANFTTFKDQIVKPIMADLIEIKIYDPANPDLILLDKRDDKAFAQAGSQLENLVQDDLRDDTIAVPTTSPMGNMGSVTGNVSGTRSLVPNPSNTTPGPADLNTPPGGMSPALAEALAKLRASDPALAKSLQQK